MLKKDISLIKYGPAVCPVENDYQIMVPVKKKVYMSVEAGGRIFYNSVNGIRISDTEVQRFTVPQKLLDKTGEYTVTYFPYKGSIKDSVSEKFSFRGIKKDYPVNIYHISDTHGLGREAVIAAKTYSSDIDLLILNGDISSSSNKISDIMLNYKIAFEITGGGIPCIITRGNHDLRGKYAERLSLIMPGKNSLPYYTVELGGLWFLVLDCGEDKVDSHREYHGLADFHSMRLKETEFIKGVAENKPFEKDGIRNRIIISHIAMNHRDNDFCNGERPFNIEDEIYNEWCRISGEAIKPQLYITGHMHTLCVHPVDSPYNDRKLPCTTLVGGKPEFGDKNVFSGAGIRLYPEKAEICFTDSRKNVSASETVIF